MELQYVITDGTKYIAKDKRCNITFVTNPDRAEKYVYDKAHNVLKNNLGNVDRDKFKVSLYEPKHSKKTNKLSLVKSLPPTPKESSISGVKIEFNWNNFIEQLDSMIDNIYVYKEQLINAQQYVDWELSDIDHFIGEQSPPAHVRTIIYGIRQQKRQERDIIHTNLRYTNVIIEAIDQGDSLAEIKNRLHGAESKPYNGRTKLYDELLGMIG